MTVLVSVQLILTFVALRLDSECELLEYKPRQKIHRKILCLSSLGMTVVQKIGYLVYVLTEMESLLFHLYK